ncbi:MAG TPA: NADH-quinone oxidoreductase subunit K [Aggregatilineales bacterium]|jgi:NADH:ubiquinone oxidoreductase subunit K|nr:NADH-quinone oxidoreductase subunit K [Aggregatilineales bacterium]
MSIPEALFIGVLILFAVGLYGLLALRNMIKLIIVLQLLVKGAVLALVAASAIHGRINFGQSLAVTVIAVDTIVAAVGLALAIQVQRHFGTLDVSKLASLKR